MFVGAAADRMAELMFRLRHAPGGIQNTQALASLETVSAAVALGARYLMAHQQADGSIKGFLLPPGASTEWITAHVAYVVEDVPRLEPFCRAAAEYLLRIGLEDGAWGYNRRVAPDCDSSAQAIMVLHRFDIRVIPVMLEGLLSTQSVTGGFPTYRPTGDDGRPMYGWQVPHPEVTAIVIEMMRRIGGCEGRVTQAESWLASELADGTLPSYWSKGSAYGLWVQARTGFMTDAAVRKARHNARTSREVPALPMFLMAAMAASDSDEDVPHGIASLLQAQRRDGSWPCSPCLRVTSVTEHRARPDAPGRVYPDKRRVFSTAHAVAALERATDVLSTIARERQDAADPRTS